LDSDFGFRIPGFSRLSVCRLRISYLFLTCWLSTSTLLAAAPDGTSDLPASSLKPPRGEIQPSFWEQHAGLIVVGATISLSLLAAAIWLLLRPRAPLPPVPAAEQARRQLEPLRQQAEDGALLSRTSQILHAYLAGAFGVAEAELTTAELCQAVGRNPEIGADLAREISEFLRESDVRKFAPGPPAPPAGAIAKALAIIDRAESRRLQGKTSVPAVSAPNLNASPRTDAAEQIANRT
jgi:hypothetical protein